jgi:hypothetical protein
MDLGFLSTYTPFQVSTLSSLFFVGTLVSVVAAVVIELFVLAALFQGLVVICSYLGVLGGFVLLLLAFAAFYSYSRGSSHARWSVSFIAPLGVLAGFIALLMVVLGYSCPLTPLRVLFVAYVIETIVAYRLRLDFRAYSRLSADFPAGVTLFTLGLLLVNIDELLILVSLLGNTVKLVALLHISIAVYAGSQRV